MSEDPSPPLAPRSCHVIAKSPFPPTEAIVSANVVRSRPSGPRTLWAFRVAVYLYVAVAYLAMTLLSETGLTL